MTIKSIAIIGGGPSGLITLDALIREKKFDNIRLFERRDQAGGCWVFDDKPPEKLPEIQKLSNRTADEPAPIPGTLPRYAPKTSKQRFLDTATYSYLESNVEATTMEYSEEPFPAGGSDVSIEKYGKETPFRHNTIIKGWLHDLYKRKGYDHHVEFDTSVELVSKNEATDKWEVTLRRFGKKYDYVWTESFDAVVVATGHYDVPYVPNIPGLQQFYDNPKNTVIHTKAYRSREHFRNKKTIVVGASVSAMDAIQDILQISDRKIISSQKKTSQPHPYFGSAAFEHPLVEKHGEITKIDNEKGIIYFDDDTSVSNVDSIIFGTGFSFSYPFLPNLDLTGNRVQGLYQHIFKIGDETLSFVGAIAAGLTFKVFEWQAVALARVYAGRAKLPSIQEQIKWEQDRIAVRGNGQKFITLYPQFQEYFELLRELAGEEGPGRRLPKFEKTWVDNFLRGHQRRINYWIENNYRQEKILERQKQSGSNVGLVSDRSPQSDSCSLEASNSKKRSIHL
ncbi:unnamed protein product [Debaryomyces fabryi]|nr:unnamed protein product [Debaryomyces fabryi]